VIAHVENPRPRHDGGQGEEREANERLAPERAHPDPGFGGHGRDDIGAGLNAYALHVRMSATPASRRERVLIVCTFAVLARYLLFRELGSRPESAA